MIKLRIDRQTLVKIAIGFLAILIVIVVSIAAVDIYKRISLPEPSWYDIAPGYTTVHRALALLGDPTVVERHGDYMVYGYIDREDLGGWEEVEIWYLDGQDNQFVTAIYRTWPIVYSDEFGRIHSSADIATLRQLVLSYGRPDMVTWSTYCGRYLIWASQGIAASAEHMTFGAFGWEMNIISVLIFKPMALDEFLRTDWPWINFDGRLSSYQTCSGGHNPDPFPEDPYDWEHMPTPEP